jgi:N-acetylglutamate synthase-like GNAT family acetyltransferase
MKVINYNEIFKEEILDLITVVQENEVNTTYALRDMPNSQTILDNYSRDNGRIWIQLKDGKAIGIIGLAFLEDKKAALRRIFVHPDFINDDHEIEERLIGTALMYAQAMNYKEIILGLSPKTMAVHQFYEKHGFEDITVTKLPSDFARMDVDTIYMKKQVVA